MMAGAACTADSCELGPDTISPFVMFARSKLRGAYLVVLLISAAPLYGQTGDKEPVRGGQLQQHLADAQELLQAGKLNEAAEQYRAFLADALSELAVGYSVAHDYTHAAPLFDEALTLEPHSPSLLLEYAQTALMLGDLAHAETLATEFIQKYPDDHEKLAQAHHVLGRTLLKLSRYQEARKELEAAVALEPTFPNGYDLAVACLDQEDEKCAAQIFSEMEKSFGDTPEIHIAFGRVYGNSDFQPQAFEEFNRALAENPRVPGAHYFIAATLLSTGGSEEQVGKAEVELKKELAISPNDSRVYALLGQFAFIQKNYAEAEKYLKKSVALDPQTPDAFLYLGQIYSLSNRSAEAEAAFRQCIRLTTDVSRNKYQVQKAHFLLGRILIENGQQSAGAAEMKAAQELASKALAQDRNDVAGLMNASGPAGTPTPAGASATSDDATVDPLALRKVEARREQVAPAVADSYNNMGSMAASNSDYSNAVRYFERANAWNPSLEGLDYNWGRAAFAGSQYADAITPLSRYVKLHPDDPGARSVFAISLFMTGDYRGCMEVLQPLIGKPDLAPQLQYDYAESMVRTGQVGLGTERLEALEKLHPEIPEVHRSLGEVLEDQGAKQRALEEFRVAIQLAPGDANAHYDLGKTELASGDTAAAIPELETAVRLLPDNEKFHEQLADAYTAAVRPTDAQKEMEICKLLRSHAQNSASPRPDAAPKP